MTSETPLTIDIEVNKSMTPNSDYDSTPNKKGNKKRKKKKKKEKKKKEKQSLIENDENHINTDNNDLDISHQHEIERKPSLKEWQEQLASNITIPSQTSTITPGIHKMCIYIYYHIH